MCTCTLLNKWRLAQVAADYSTKGKNIKARNPIFFLNENQLDEQSSCTHDVFYYMYNITVAYITAYSVHAAYIIITCMSKVVPKVCVVMTYDMCTRF